MSPQLQEVADLARNYCELVERADERDSTWLQEVAAVLPRLHAAILALGNPRKEKKGEPLVADLDARFELFTYLRRLLGDRDSYWLEFDGTHDKQCMSGSLADDLTDIYCELKHGLRLIETETTGYEQALEGWRHSYMNHWGQHLLDAERHLYGLMARGELAL